LNLDTTITLPVTRYRLQFVTVQTVRLPPYAGSAWRGALGHVLKRLVCVTREPHCPQCLLYRSCTYPYLFATPTDPSDPLLSKIDSAPRPFIVLPDARSSGVCPPGTALSVQLTLIGHSHRQLPYVIHAFDQAAQRGLGIQRGQLRFESALQQRADETWVPIYRPGEVLHPEPVSQPTTPPCPQQVQVELHTPLRLRHQGRYVTPERFSVGVMFAHLLRRIALLKRLHTDHPLNADFAGLVQHGHTVALHAQALYWQDGKRYSSRQKAEVPLGGLRGQFTLAGEGLVPLWPYLWLGQWTHVGKGTCMGLGGYRLVE